DEEECGDGSDDAHRVLQIDELRLGERGQRGGRPRHPVQRVAGMVLLVPAHRQGKRLYVERVGEALAHDEGGESLEDASRTVHRPGDADGGEHQEQVVARRVMASMPSAWRAVTASAKYQGKGTPTI